MSTTPAPGDKTLVLVESLNVMRLGNQVLEQERTVFTRLIRSYDASQSDRAREDLVLAQTADAGGSYELVEIPHIER